MRQICSAVLTFALLTGTFSDPLTRAQSRGHEKGFQAATPIKHVVVIFDENNSFDHYFGSYPNATNPPGEPAFYPTGDTPAVNGLNGPLLTHNPNSVAPFRLDRSMAVTCDNDNHYTDEQKAYDAGLLDKFVQDTSNNGPGCTPGLAMGYYDGNTVTALWNYAQHFAMDQAHHQYDLSAFWAVLANGNLPAVSFVKPPHVLNGHPSDSTPLAEQTFLVNTINQLQQSPEWRDMAILVTYDDSDGWYDHVMPPIVSQSNDPANDALLGPTGLCGTPAAGAYLDRCGYGERLPFLVISPFAKHNYVDHSVNDTTSILRFIEDNWNLGRIGDQSFDAIAGSFLTMFDFDDHRTRRTILDPDTGEVIRCDE